MRDLVNSLEEANDRYMEDNRMLTSKLLERTSLLKHMEEKIELLTQQNKNLVEKNIEVTKLGDIQREKVETFKNKDKKKESRINELELELECEGKKLKTLSEKFNKSKNEILQLNKGKFDYFFFLTIHRGKFRIILGINRKIDQVRKLTSDSKVTEEKLTKFQAMTYTDQRIVMPILCQIHVNMPYFPYQHKNKSFSG